MSDSLRPKGTVEVTCTQCGYWSFWIDALDPRLPDGPFLCSDCDGSGAKPGIKCDCIGCSTPGLRHGQTPKEVLS